MTMVDNKKFAQELYEGTR